MSTRFMKWYLKLIVFFRGFHICEDPLPEKGELIRTYAFVSNYAKTIDFFLYKVNYVAKYYRFGRYKKVQYVNYVLIAKFDESLPKNITRYNKMSLKSYGAIVGPEAEYLFLQIAVNRFVSMMYEQLR